MKVRGKVGLEEMKGGREQIVITEIPFNVNRAVLVERIAELVNEKIITDITAMRDESDENTRRRDRDQARRDAQGGHQQSLSSTPRWKRQFRASTRWPSTTAGRRRSA